MDQWNYARSSQPQGHSQGGQLGYGSGSYGGQPASSASAAQYGYSHQNYGQAYGQQSLGIGGKSDDYQGAPTGGGGYGVGSNMNRSGIYGLDSKYPGGGYGIPSASATPFSQKTDQLGGGQKGSDFLMGQYSKSQSSYLASESQNAPLKRYSESQQSQAIRQQHLMQSAVRQGPAPSALDGGARSQMDYLSAGRNSALQTAGPGAYGGGRELLGGAYGVGHPDVEAGLLGNQVGLASRGYSSQPGDPLGPLPGARGILGSMYPPGPGYGALDLSSARSGISAMSDLSGIGSARYDDRLDDRMTVRYDYGRHGDRRNREQSREHIRDRDFDHERERSWERVRDRERERLKEKERAHERERARARDREREKEREQRRRERTPPRVPPLPKRDEKVVRRTSPPTTRFSSPTKSRRQDYVCKIEPLSLVEVERDLLSLIRRYPKLFVSADFSKVVTFWREKASEIPLHNPISFEHDAVDAEEECEIKDSAAKSFEEIESSKETITWNVKVMLMSGMSDECVKTILSECQTDDKPLHMHNLLKFVVLRKERSALMAVGGSWDRVLDGENPRQDETLIHTAIRCTKDAIQLDLSKVSTWTRFMEIHYDRTSGCDNKNKEISVYLIPDLSCCLPTLDDWRLQWKQRKEQSKLRREADQKQDKGACREGSPKANSNGVNSDGESGKKDVKEGKSEKEEKNEKHLKRDDKRDINEEETRDRDLKKEDKEAKPEHKKEKDGRKEDKLDTKKDKMGKTDRKDEKEKDEKLDKEKDRKMEKKTKPKPEEEAPPLPGLFIVSKKSKSDKMRTMTLSLEGLLDYDERDKEESTFELSLFAEAFHEMLQYKFGCHILEALEGIHHVVQAKKKEDRKRGRESDSGGKSKKSKLSDKASVDTSTHADSDQDKDGHSNNETTDKNMKKEEKDENKAVKDIDVAMQEASLINFDEIEEELQEPPKEIEKEHDKKTVQENETEQPEQQMTVDEELLKAFRYFDRNRVGFLKAEDVRRLVHILGKFLSRRCVKDITASALIESKSKDDCIYYRRLVEKAAE